MKTIYIGTSALIAVLVLVLASCSSPYASMKTITPIYAATAGGLSVFNGSSWKNYTNANTSGGLLSDTVNGVSVSGSGSTATIYAATSLGISVFDGSSWTDFTNGSTSSGLGSGAVHGIFLGTYLYAATDSGLSVSDGSSWKNYTTTDGLASNTVNGVYSDGANTYVATSAGLSILNEASVTTLASFLNNDVQAVFLDQGLDIYAGTSAGLAIFQPDGTLFETFTSSNGYIPNNNVHSVFVDSSYNIYVGTDGGLAVYTYSSAGYTLNVYTAADGLGSDVVQGVYVVGSSIYAATTGGLSVSTNGGTSWTTYTTANGLGSNNVYGVYVTPPLYSY